jgi:cleavage stimulation factor subunit 3
MSASVASRRPKRLASDVIGQLEDVLKINDRDLPAWLQLIQYVVVKDKTEQVRDVYEKCLKKFPFLEHVWIEYIQYELTRGEFDKVDELFKRCLFQSTGVELWKTYVDYIRRKNNLITGGEEARRVIFQGYDLAVTKVGQDPESGSLWEEYVQFVDDWRPGSTWDEQQKLDLKRTVLKRALTSPLVNLESLWTVYTTFENDLNPTTARKFIGDISGAYMNARSWYKEWSTLTQGLDRSNEIIPEGVHSPEQLKKWRRWIAWEKQNKLELEDSKLMERIDYVFQMSTQKLMFHPELWFEMCDFYKQHPKYYSSTKIQELLNVSLLVNPAAFSLNLRLIELYELDNNSALVKKRFEALIEHLTKQHTQLSETINDLKESALIDYVQSKSEEDSEKPINDEEKTHVYAQNQGIQSLTSQLQHMAKTITLTYCTYMKCMKRLGGLEEARLVFKACRKSKTLTHHIFSENAMVEYHASSKAIALKVFELGLKPAFFGEDGEYIYKYVKFLIKIQDDINARTVFETTLKKEIAPEWMKKLFKLMMRYESTFGSLASVGRLEEKYHEMFPKEKAIEAFADRYSFNEHGEFNADDDLIRYNDLRERDTTSSKRPLDDDDDDLLGSQKKVRFEDDERDVKEEEPKGEFVTDEIYNLLRLLPNASAVDEPKINNSKLISLLQHI